MPRYPYSFKNPVVGKCYYCGKVVRAFDSARVPDPGVMVYVGTTLEQRPVKRLTHSGKAGYFCESILRERFRSVGIDRIENKGETDDGNVRQG